MNALPLTALPLHALVGVPYVRGAADPAHGFDCWTLVAYVRRHYFDLPTPVCAPQPPHTLRSAILAIDATRALPGWQRIDAPGWPGAVVGMSARRIGVLHHVGVVVPGGVLHAWEGMCGGGTGSVVLTPWPRLPTIMPCVEVFEWRD